MKKLFLFIFIINLLACHKDTDRFIPNPTTPLVLVNASIGGAVIDENNAPVVGATVQLGTEKKETDQNGVFIFRNVEVNSTRAYLTVQKAGYFQGSRSIIPQRETTNIVRVKLLSNEEIGTIAAAAGGDLVLPGGTVITFPSNGVRVAGGANYSGTIHVAAKYLDPTSSDFAWKMPGDWIGLNTNDFEQALASFGILAFELRGDNGELLELTKEAEIRLPIPDQMIADAPTTIPLWFFDPMTGFWKENGSGLLQEGVFSGRVSQLPFLNFANPFELIEIKGTVVDSQGEPLSSIRVNLNFVGNVAVQSSWTDSKGNYTGTVPAGQLLHLEILDECGNQELNQEVGPFNSNTDFSGLDLDNNNHLRTISGRIMDCNNKPLSNAYVKIDLGESFEIAYTDPNGNFNASILGCSDNDPIQLIGVNLEDAKQSPSFNYTTTTSSIDAGRVLACTDLEEYISFTLDGTDFLNIDPSAGKNQSGDFTDFGGESNESSIFLNKVNGINTGNFDIDQINVNNLNSNQGVAPNITVTFTGYGAVGEIITGTFGGEFEDTSGASHVISGSFRIQRDN